jgi:hypothetical protein
MPAIFFLTLPPAADAATWEHETGVEPRSAPDPDDMLGYSGRLLFDGGFDRFGCVPRREYGGGGETLGGHRPDASARYE